MEREEAEAGTVMQGTLWKIFPVIFNQSMFLSIVLLTCKCTSVSFLDQKIDFDCKVTVD